MRPEYRREIITWEEVDRLIDYLIPQFKREFTAMVIITRGGIVPGGLLADAMNITHILTAAVDFPAQSANQHRADQPVDVEEGGEPEEAIGLGHRERAAETLELG